MTCPLPITRWWQDYVAGRLKTPRALFRAAWGENPDPAQSSARVFDVPDPGPSWDAPERLKAPLHFASESYMRQQVRADWTDCDPRLIVWAALFIAMAKKRQIPLYVHSALRSKAEQDKAVASGASKAKYPRSAHNIGEAVDIVHGVYHWQMNRSEWALLHVLGNLALDRLNATLKADHKLELTWGGNFKTLYDPAHWEITDYRARIRALPDPAQPMRMSPYQALKQRDALLYGLTSS